MYKDHKAEGGYRPVVGGCSSDTLGLSNTLSEVVKSICMSVDEPYEVISGEDLLSRISKCNERLGEMKKMRDKEKEEKETLKEDERNAEWDWRDHYVLLGTDVTSLFPSLSAKNTGRAVKNQIMKSKMKWSNIDTKWLSLYLRLNEKDIDIKE